MYRVTRNRSLPRIFKNTEFFTYEIARRAVRKWLRAARDVRGNAAISDFGFSIQRTT